MFKFKTRLTISITVLSVVVIGGTIIVSSQNSPNRAEVSSPSNLIQKPDNLKIPPGAENQRNRNLPQYIPDDIAYGQIFKHLEELNKKADQEEQVRGKDGQKLRNLYKKMARLDERQARVLDRIAEQTNRELKKLDERARQIIDQVRAQTPNRRIERGQKPPVPPQELFDLARKRKDVVTEAIELLRKEFGEGEFVRFSQFLNEKIKPGIKKIGNGSLVQKGGQPK
jgi:hypothetical protein